MKSRFSGQQAIEFALVSGIILLGSLMGYFFLSQKLSGFFTSDSAIAKTYSHKVNTVSASSVFYENNQAYNLPSSPANNSSTAKVQTVNGVPINFSADGSANFAVNGQQITLTSDTMNNLNTVFETVGPAGLDTEVVRAIQLLVNENQSNFPGQAVPVNMVFGDGSRYTTKQNTDTGANESISYDGTASMNIVSISVGGHSITIQKDHGCSGGICTGAADRKYVINNKKQSDGTFVGTFTSNIDVVTNEADPLYANSYNVRCTSKSSSNYPDNCSYNQLGNVASTQSDPFSAYTDPNIQNWTFNFNDNSKQKI